MNKTIILNITLSSIITCFLTYFLVSPEQKTKNPMKELFAQAGTSKALLLILGNTCPPGFKTPEQAGLNAADWYGRFPLMSQIPDADTNGVMDVGGSTVTGANNADHIHGTGTPIGNSCNIACTSGGLPINFTNHAHATGNQSQNHGHTFGPPYLHLKPCIWSMN